MQVDVETAMLNTVVIMFFVKPKNLNFKIATCKLLSKIILNWIIADGDARCIGVLRK